MDFASAYPDSNISAWSMTLIALVAAVSLAAWLILVFRADRQGSRKEARKADVRTPVPAALAPAAEDEQSKARHGAAA